MQAFMCYNSYVQRNRRIVQNGGRFVDSSQISFNVPASLRRSLVTNLANPVSLNTKLAKGVTGLSFARKDNMSIPFTWVYLIFDPYTKLFKVGKSDNPSQRLKQLSNGSNYGTIPAAPMDYRLVEAWLCPEGTEAALHQFLTNVRVRGEWFDLSKHFGIDANEDYLADRVEQRFTDYLGVTHRFYAFTPSDLETAEIKLAQANYQIDELKAIQLGDTSAIQALVPVRSYSDIDNNEPKDFDFSRFIPGWMDEPSF